MHSIPLIAITGPESSGKSTLARRLAEEFNVDWVPEYARTYLETKGTNYTAADIINIALGQCALVESELISSDERPFLISDTWMLETVIWTQYKYNKVPEVIGELYREHPPAFYVLCSPDLVWEPDPLRENPDDRDVLFTMYYNAILESGVPYVVVSGAQREVQAIEAIRVFMSS